MNIININWNYSYFFDFLTIWSHYFYTYSLFMGDDVTKLSGRVLITMTSFFGSMILLGRSSDTICAIRKQVKLGFDDTIIDTIGNHRFACLLDIVAHGVPLIFIMCSTPLNIDKYMIQQSVVQIITFTICFLSFELIRGIDIRKTYALHEINISFIQMYVCILLFVVQVYPICINPQLLLLGWKAIGFTQMGSVGANIFLYYYIFYLFGK